MRARGFAQFDVVIAMYHDQGLIPVKYLGLEDGVNITVGLPFVRTSPDHGTAFDIAGKGVADTRSLAAAIRMADDMSRGNRAAAPSAGTARAPTIPSQRNPHHDRLQKRYRHQAHRLRCARRCSARSSGDDVFGDDPTVNRLQEQAAELLGFEAALYAPSGTQTNLIALMSQCQRGDEAIVGQMWHTYRWEGGGMAVLGSIQPQPVENQPDGTLRLQDIEAAIKPDDPHFARTRLIALENTTGGKVLPLDYLRQVSRTGPLPRAADASRRRAAVQCRGRDRERAAG